MLPTTSTKLSAVTAQATKAVPTSHANVVSSGSANVSSTNPPTASTSVSAAQVSAMQKQERIPNLHRVQMALHSVLQADRAASTKKIEYRMESHAADLITDYSSELALCILEDAAIIAKHRGAAQIEPSDINIILVKKYNIHIPPAIAEVPRLVLHAEELGTGEFGNVNIDSFTLYFSKH
jgi:histone H3/H4